MKAKLLSILVIAMLVLTACGKNGSSSDSITDSGEKLPDEKLSAESEYENYKFIKYDKDTDLKSKYFDITVKEGTVLPEHFEEMCDMVGDDVKKVLDLDFYPDGNVNNNRITIHVQREMRAQCDPDRNIFLTEDDTNLYNGCSHVLAHELGHMTQWANYGSFGRMPDEGIATYTASMYYKVSKLPSIYTLDDTIAHYSLPDESELKSDLINKFDKEPERDMMQYYAQGLRLTTFMEETYGAGTIKKVFGEFAKAKVNSGAQFIATLKKVLGDDVLTKYSKWGQDTSERMNQNEPEIDYSDCKTIYYMPMKYQDVWNREDKEKYYYYCPDINGKIKDELTIDFKKGYEYYNMCENKSLEISGSLKCKSPCTVKLYDKDKKLIALYKAEADTSLSIKKKGTCYMKVEGNGNVTFSADINDMFPEDLRMPDYLS